MKYYYRNCNICGRKVKSMININCIKQKVKSYHNICHEIYKYLTENKRLHD